MDELDTTEEVKVRLREKQTELIRLIEAYAKLETSQEWETIKELVFSRSLASLEKQILQESLSAVIDLNKLYRLQGEWTKTKQYDEPNRFIGMLKKQLEDINKQLK